MGATERTFCYFGPFFTLLPYVKTQKIKNGNNIMYGFCDIRHDRHCFFVILGHFLPFDPFNNPLKSKFWKNEKSLEILFYTSVPQMAITWCLVLNIWSATEFFVILYHFFPFYSTSNAENQNFEKLKKKSWDIIISHLCTTNDNHMMYGSSDMEHNR